ncbi:MAG TPA: DUF2752 domain-containing protein [bacterium]|nr:DUF2752 domain-containing protein [bacterium]
MSEQSSRPLWRLSTFLEARVAWLCVLAIVASFFLPERGLGFSFCLTRSLLGRPCPMCGLTRSVTCISHLHFEKAMHYHPLGFIIYVGLVVSSLVLLTPACKRERLRTWLRMSSLDWIPPTLFLSVLFVFGLWRFIWGVCP